MKLMSARSSSAPAPFDRQKRPPVILTARSKSRMSSAAPMSTWSLTGKEKARGVPHVRTTGLSSSPAPSGTEGSGTFGMERSNSSIFRSIAGSSASASLSSKESAFIRSMSSGASFFSRRRRPISSEAALRSARIPSTSTSRSRRALSNATKPSRVRVDRRFLSASSTIAIFSRTNFRSSMVSRSVSIMSGFFHGPARRR